MNHCFFFICVAVSHLLHFENRQDFFLCSQGPKFDPISNGILGDFFPNLKNKPNLRKKNIFFEDWDFFSDNIHTSYMMTLSFNLMEIVSVIANLFFY